MLISMSQPPYLARRLLHRFCRPELVEAIDGDLEESFADWWREGSLRQARWRYWREVLLLLRPQLMRSFGQSFDCYLPIDMWKNYFKIAVRQISRHRLFSALNVMGLALSLSVCSLIIMILIDQYSYDRFQTEGDRTYRVISDAQREGVALKGQLATNGQFATAPLRLVEELEQNYPFVERTIPLRNARFPLLKGELPLKMNGFYTDGRFLEGFSFGWQRGDRGGALDDPREIVLTQGAVERLFDGTVELGQVVQVDGVGECLLTGIMPNPPLRSQLRFDYLLSLATLPEEEIAWRSIYQSYVYAQLQPGTDPARLSEALTAIAQEQSATDEKMNFYFEPQPMMEVVPGRGLANTPTEELPVTVLHLLEGLAAIILLLAIFNYTNLGLARALRRAREVSIRKVAGARRDQIIGQMLVESVMVALPRRRDHRRRPPRRRGS
jgi:putative ABC transport system permease protein